MAEREYLYRQKTVSIGGGTGQFAWLRGATRFNFPEYNTAVTSTWDSGGKSGEDRISEGILPQGDYLQCLLGCMEDEEQLEEALIILRDRSEGHPLLHKMAVKSEKSHHGVQEGIDGLRKLFRIRARIFPVSSLDTDLHAETAHGQRYHREHMIDELKDDPNFSVDDIVSRIYLEPRPKASPKVCEAIAEADKIIIPPGSPFTSIFPHLLVRGIPQAIRESKGKLAVVMNLMTTRGEDHHLTTASRWLQVFQYYLQDQRWIEKTGRSRVDYLVVNENHIDPEIIERYKNQGQQLIKVDRDECRRIAPGLEIVQANLVDYHRYAHLLRHNPDELAKTILELR